MFKDRLSLGHNKRLGSLGAQPIFPKPGLAGAYPGTWLTLLESCVWRCGTGVHSCSKHVL
jgi:hypothetical protein